MSVRLNNYRILSLNIRGINANLNELIVFLTELNLNIDIIVLSETRQLECETCVSLPNYKTFYNFSKFNQNDGVVVFVKDSISAVADIVTVNNFVFFRLSCTNYLFNQNISITALYKPPSFNSLDFLDLLDEYIVNYCNCDLEIITGDININIDTHKLPEHIATTYLNTLYRHGFISCINEPTRISNNSTSCIDHFLLNRSFIILHYYQSYRTQK